MKKIAYYVLYSEQQISQFRDKFSFIPVLAINPSLIDSIDASLFFNKTKAFEKLNRQITNEEIAHTLSHIKCWREIAENNELSDEDFALIAESDIQLVNNFENLVQSYANKYPSYGIIKLQKNGEYYSNKRLFQEGDEPDAIIYGDINKYNNGCSLYLIRKDIAKKLSLSLNESKPHWLAEQFTEFHEPSNIAQAYYLLGEIPKEKLQDKVENPLFSIIVPIYNVERYLEQCIESVIAQDYQNYELILVDDGSPDNSIDICIKYAKKYKNIIVIHKINGGLSDARNAGMRIARGEYLMFLDSDDYWEGEHILSDLARIIKPNTDLIMYDCTLHYPDDRKEYFPISKNNLHTDFKSDFEELVSKNIFRPAAWTKVIKRNIIIENKLFFPEGKNHEDLDWSFNLAEYISSYSLYDSYFYNYRVKRKGAITEFAKIKNTEDLLDITIHHLKGMDNIKESTLYKGLSKYIISQKSFIDDSYNHLIDEDKEK